MRKATLAAIALATLPALAFAAGGVVIDYRDHAFLVGSPFYSQADRARIAAELAQAPDGAALELGDAFVVLGDADGAFSKAGAAERIHLIQQAAPAAIDPFPQGAAPLLLVTSGGKYVTSFRLPAEVQYQRLVAAADSDGDGVDEVLLETSFMNMGQMVIGLHAIGFADGKASVKQELPEVYFDGCENPQGEKSRSASTISVAGGAFKAEAVDIGCD